MKTPRKVIENSNTAPPNINIEPTRAVRNNNPGNIRDYRTGEFATYDTPAEGTEALLHQLDLYKSGKSSHTTGEENLSELMHIYAPSSDHNDPVAYTKDLANILGVTPTTPIKDIPTGELATAIAQIEDPAMHEVMVNDPKSVEVLRKDSAKAPEPVLQWGNGKIETVQPELSSPANITAPTERKAVVDNEERGRLEEAYTTLKDEGVSALAGQLGNYVKDKVNAQTGGNKGIVIEQKEVFTEDEWYAAAGMRKAPTMASNDMSQKWLQPSMPEMTLLGGDITMNGKNHTPLAVNTGKVEFGFRNRGETGDIKTKGVLFSTYNPFRTSADYLGYHKGEANGGFGSAKGKGYNTEKDTVIALNTKTGEVMGGMYTDFKDNKDIVMSRTLPAKKVTSMSAGSENKYFKTIYQKGTRLHTTNGSYVDVPIGIGNQNKGNAIGDYSGGKMFITKPDGTEGHFVYGSVQQLSKQLENYKKTHQIEHVLWYDMDHKAFSQAFSTKSGVVKGDWLNSNQHDHTNSSGGSFLYLK